VQRARFTVEEVVQLTMDFYRRNYIEGLFLSSGIIRNPDYTMEQVVGVARTLRDVHQFRGYIHLKTIPEASPELIALAGKYADRISINVELPTGGDLERLAPEKNLGRIRHSMNGIKAKIDQSKAERRESPRAPSFAPAGQSTQMIVGATPTSDSAILDQASSMYREHRLRRVYYSAFSPIPDSSSKLPLISPPLVREHRLYQADWLMRFYGFKAAELTTTEQPNLEIGMDPKLSWALRNREKFPVDLNRAPRELMLRVPGLGVKNVDRLLSVRRWHRLKLADLARLRVPMKKTLPFIQVADHNPHVLGLDRDKAMEGFKVKAEQLELFTPAAIPSSVLNGQL
jgi:putative DNA modification/repair radical SAM protein